MQAAIRFFGLYLCQQLLLISEFRIFRTANDARNQQLVFTARCTLVQTAVLRSYVVCLSVCLSVTLVDCDHIGWNSSKIISPTVSPGFTLCNPNKTGLLQAEHP